MQFPLEKEGGATLEEKRKLPLLILQEQPLGEERLSDCSPMSASLTSKVSQKRKSGY